VRVFPGEPGKGVVRIGGDEVLVWGPQASDPDTSHRCTQVQGIGPLEHLSAAAVILGVRGWVLEADHGDLPLFDGSSIVWAKMLERIPRETPFAEIVDLQACSWQGESRGHLEIQPDSKFHLKVEWSFGPFGSERWEGSMAELGTLLGARTFVDAPDWWEAAQRGLLQGVDGRSGRMLAGRSPLPAQALAVLVKAGIVSAGPVWSGGDERLPGECAAHKALDLVGDIACAIGYLPALRIIARDTGHNLHARLGQALRHAHRENEETSHATPVRPSRTHDT
jgi:UDP-3-O-acyl-N-acetylglucosamine deacetylase